MIDNETLLQIRRRSVDVGGLALALEDQGMGHGWGGWEESDKRGTIYAELLSDMHNQSQMAVSHCHEDYIPADVTPDTRIRLINSLDSWGFEPHKLPDEEILPCTIILFECLYRIQGMREDISLPLDDLSLFLQHLRQIYRHQNSYHNFQHALDVLQACHVFLHAAGSVPPVSILLQDDDHMWVRSDHEQEHSFVSQLLNVDVFMLFVAAIGHDVGHPGFTNMFMKNAQTPLSVVYDDKSALEQMHYVLLTRTMQSHGLGDFLERGDSTCKCRKTLSSVVLATDMSVHFEFMKNFEMLLQGAQSSICHRRRLILQALIKCADISNPSRPPSVSNYWASALTSEWTSQAVLEKHLYLPASVTPSKDPLGQARGQIFFITTFAKPLMDLTAQAIPEMAPFAAQCARNLAMWEARCSQLSADSGSKEIIYHPHIIASPRAPEDYLTVFPLTLPASFLSEYGRSSLSSDWRAIDDSVMVTATVMLNPGPTQSGSKSGRSVIPPSLLATSPIDFERSPLSSSESDIATPLPLRPSSNATSVMRAAYNASTRKRSRHRPSLSASARTSIMVWDTPGP